MEKDARVTVGVDGAEDVKRAAREALDPWKQAGASVESSFRKAGSVIGQQLTQIGMDALRTVTVMRTLDLGAAVAGARTYREEIARLGVAGGMSVGKVRSEMEKLSRRTLEGEPQITAWTRSYGRATYDIEGALGSIAALHDESVATGKSMDEMMGFGRTLEMSFGATEGLEGELGRVRAQAELLGNIGGVSAFQDQIQKIVESVGGLSTLTSESRDKFTALLGVLGRFGGSVQQAGTIQQGIVGFGVQNATLSNFLGGIDIYGDKGQLDPDKLVESLRWTHQKYRQWIPNRKFRMEALRSSMGPEAAAAFEAGDWDEIRRQVSAVAKAPASGGAAAASAAYASTEAGQADAIQLEAARRLRDAAESLVRAGDAWNALFAQHPIAGQVAGGVVQGTAGAALLGLGNWLMRGGAPGAGAGGAAAIEGAAGFGSAAGSSFAATAIPLIAAGLAGIKIGTTLDEALGISSALSGTDPGATRTRLRASNEIRLSREEAAEERREDLAVELVKAHDEARTGKSAVVLSDELARFATEDPLGKQVQRGLRTGEMDFGRLPKEFATAVRDALQSTTIKVINVALAAPPPVDRPPRTN